MFAYDHTVNNFPPTKHKSLHFVKTGIGTSNTMAWHKGKMGNVKTLGTLLRENGHLSRVINYLKVCCRLILKVNQNSITTILIG